MARSLRTLRTLTMSAAGPVGGRRRGAARRYYWMRVTPGSTPGSAGPWGPRRGSPRGARGGRSWQGQAPDMRGGCEFRMARRAERAALAAPLPWRHKNGSPAPHALTADALALLALWPALPFEFRRSIVLLSPKILGECRLWGNSPPDEFVAVSYWALL